MRFSHLIEEMRQSAWTTSQLFQVVGGLKAGIPSNFLAVGKARAQRPWHFLWSPQTAEMDRKKRPSRTPPPMAGWSMTQSGTNRFESLSKMAPVQLRFERGLYVPWPGQVGIRA